jgi:hypothetical protein
MPLGHHIVLARALHPQPFGIGKLPTFYWSFLTSGIPLWSPQTGGQMKTPYKGNEEFNSHGQVHQEAFVLQQCPVM